MTFAQLKGQVLTAMEQWSLANQQLHPIFPEIVAEWVQAAIYKLDADLLWTQSRETFDTEASTRRYAVDEAILHIQTVTCDGYEMTPLTVPEEVAKYEADDTESTPQYYSWFAAEIALYPVPSEADLTVELWCNKRPDALSDDDDEPTLPAHVHPLLVDYALYQAFRHVGDVEHAGACLAMYRAAREEEQSNMLNTRGIMAARLDSKVV